jgi:hypothetical protein
MCIFDGWLGIGIGNGRLNREGVGTRNVVPGYYSSVR